MKLSCIILLLSTFVPLIAQSAAFHAKISDKLRGRKWKSVKIEFPNKPSEKDQINEKLPSTPIKQGIEVFGYEVREANLNYENFGRILAQELVHDDVLTTNIAFRFKVKLDIDTGPENVSWTSKKQILALIEEVTGTIDTQELLAFNISDGPEWMEVARNKVREVKKMYRQLQGKKEMISDGMIVMAVEDTIYEVQRRRLDPVGNLIQMPDLFNFLKDEGLVEGELSLLIEKQ